MLRGYYLAVRAGQQCPHRHYELSAALARCMRQLGGAVVYVDAQGRERAARPDEMQELAAKASGPLQWVPARAGRG